MQHGPRRLKKRYDVVVVGSGPAGSVVSRRLARSGLRVAVIERGSEHRSGSRPVSPGELVTHSQLWRNGLRIGAADALFDLRVFDDVMVLTGCGVGGTSLINPSVSVMPDPEVMEDRRWPAELRDDCGWVDDADAAADHLHQARSSGAQVFASCSVSHVEVTAHGWAVVVTDTAQPSVRRRVEADRVVLAAGALGSTEVLLRSRDAGLETSPMLGHRFSGNGDLTAWGFDTDETLDGLGVRTDTQHNEDDHWMTEGAAMPGIFVELTPLLLAVSTLLDRLLVDEGPERTVGWLRSLLDGPDDGAVARTTTATLFMAADDGEGQVRLVGSGVEATWPDTARQRRARAPHDSGHRHRIGNRPVSIHPLGGCVMGGDAGDGVVDHRGRVFAGGAGRHTHGGLYVADGSVVPRSLGADPSLTIVALAERTARLMLVEMGLEAGAVEQRRPTRSQRSAVPPQG